MPVVEPNPDSKAGRHSPSTCARRPCPPVALALLLLLGLLAAAPVAVAHPEPSIVPRAWSFDFEYRDPELIAVQDIHGQTRWYWYMHYQVTNHTGRERLFIPEFTIATDEGDLITANAEVSNKVFKAIQERENAPLLVTPIKVLGRLLLGEDQARESVAIWPVFDHAVGRVDIFISGLSGETVRFVPPGAEESIVMRKTLMLKYRMPGAPRRIQDRYLELLDTEWVMR